MMKSPNKVCRWKKVELKLDLGYSYQMEDQAQTLDKTKKEGETLRVEVVLQDREVSREW